MNTQLSQDEILDRLLNRGVETILPSKEYLQKRLASGDKLNIYQGFDPTADTLHIGHTVGMRKLRDFQLLGHSVTFLIGDFTGRIGDPSDKTAARQTLTKEQVEENLKLYVEQASKIIDFKYKKNPIKIQYNSTWHDKLTFAELIDVTSDFTVQQMIKRDMFQKRLETDRPIYLHEFLYPVMQAYDAFAMNTDVEVGGNDQTFNMLCGRDFIMKRLKKEKCVLAVKLLTDPTGKKMGKSEGNMIMLSDTPENMFGKVMAFPDTVLALAFELLTDLPISEVSEMQTQMQAGKMNPMEAKKKLAYMITAEHKGEDAAKQAQTHFEQVFQQKDDGSDITTIAATSIGEQPIKLTDLLVKNTSFAPSNSEAKRLIEHGAVSIDGIKVTDKNYVFTATQKEAILRAGRKVAKLII